MKHFHCIIALLGIWALHPAAVSAQNPRVVLETNFGNIVIELYPDAAPVTVNNFLTYVYDGFYNGIIFHRSINNFMIQAGAYYIRGFYIYQKPPTYGPIINESNNGLSNVRGTVSTALSNSADSANSQFFINQVDNTYLDYPNVNGYGHCVFGNVIDGMDAVDSIANLDPDYTCYLSPALTNLPCDPPVFIHTAYELPAEFSYNSDLAKTGRISFEDFAVLASYWLDDCSSANGFCNGADLDYSGGVDLIDLDLFWNHWTRPAGYETRFSDLVYDHTVDTVDLTVFIQRWLNSSCNPDNNYCDRADINRDGHVDLTDYSLLGNNWQQSY